MNFYRKNNWLHASRSIALIVLLVAITVAGFELTLRIYHQDFAMRDLRQIPVRDLKPDAVAPAAYHSELGWLPRPGIYNWPTGWTQTIGKYGVRISERHSLSDDIILAVGDSFTFGDEVNDNETWPAFLQEILNQPVINGGVFGYGLDQMVLRAELLLMVYKPEALIITIIPDDITRCELSYFHGWKPYFDIQGDQLVARNIPVPPQSLMPPSRIPTLFGYSYLARAFLRRITPHEWYHRGGRIRVHDNGLEVSKLLLDRLAVTTQRAGARLLVVTLTTTSESRSNRLQFDEFVDYIETTGIELLNLAPEILTLLEKEPGRVLRFNHLDPDTNKLIAEKIAMNAFSFDL